MRASPCRTPERYGLSRNACTDSSVRRISCVLTGSCGVGCAARACHRDMDAGACPAGRHRARRFRAALPVLGICTFCPLELPHGAIANTLLIAPTGSRRARGLLGPFPSERPRTGRSDLQVPWVGDATMARRPRSRGLRAAAARQLTDYPGLANHLSLILNCRLDRCVRVAVSGERPVGAVTMGLASLVRTRRLRSGRPCCR
jgi:hypothetical protein